MPYLTIKEYTITRTPNVPMDMVWYIRFSPFTNKWSGVDMGLHGPPSWKHAHPTSAIYQAGPQSPTKHTAIVIWINPHTSSTQENILYGEQQ